MIYRIVITVTALFIVCLYMPRDERSTYQFDVGKPWRYSQLIATYDFPIYKSTETIQTEQDSILQHYEPYFAIDETVGKEQIEKFKATINGQKPATIPANYLAYVENKLEHIYAQGVMDTEDFDQMHSDEVASIRIFAQNVAKEQPMTQVFSHKTAYEYLIDLGEDSLHYDRRVLRKCNLSDYIVPNLTYDKTKSEESRKDLLSSLSYSSGMVMSRAENYRPRGYRGQGNIRHPHFSGKRIYPPKHVQNADAYGIARPNALRGSHHCLPDVVLQPVPP